MSNTSDLVETIARWRERLRCVPDHEVIDLEVTGREANALLAAAEAGIAARDAALEEAAAAVDNMREVEESKRGRYVLDIAAGRIRALRRPT